MPALRDLLLARLLEAGFELRDRLRALGYESFVKTSGGHGFHIVVPLLQPSWEAGLAFARSIVESMAADSPRRYTTDMSKSVRAGRVYLDYLRNARGSTSVAAYASAGQSRKPSNAGPRQRASAAPSTRAASSTSPAASAASAAATAASSAASAPR